MVVSKQLSDGGARSRPKATIPGPQQRQPTPPPPAPAPYYGPGATIPGPIQRAPTPRYVQAPASIGPAYKPAAAPVYRAPAPAPAPAPVYAPPPASYGGGGGGFAGGPAGGGGGGFDGPAAPPPPRQLSEDEWLAGDADYKDQNNEYDRALEEFKRRISSKRKNFEDDARLSTAATQKNQDTTLNELGEDFAARGMGYSGLFADRKNKVQDSFRNQLANVETVKNRSLANADEELADYSSENQLSRGNAKRQALARMAAQQALINAGGAF